MPAFDLQHDAILDKVGQFGTQAVLRRSDGDRPCMVFFSSFTPMEMIGRTIEPTMRKLIMPVTPDIEDDPPNFQTDRLVTLNEDGSENENLSITEPAQRVAPNDTTVFWRLVVRR